MSFYLMQILTGLSTASLLFLVASGLSLIFGVSRILNFAHGSFYMLGAYIAYSLTQRFGGEMFGFWGSLLLSGVIVGVLGTAVEMLILRRIYHVPEIFQLLATFGIALIVQDVALHTWGPEDLLGPQAPGLAGAIPMLGEQFPTYDILLIIFAVIICGAIYAFLHYTRAGILIRAATQDREMLMCLGVNQKWLFTGVFFLGSFLAGLAGALQLPRESVSLSMDMSIMIEAFVVVVIGGMGSLPGALLAAIVVGITQAFGILLFPKSTLILIFLIMSVVLIFKPYGLLGEKEEGVGAASRSLFAMQNLRMADMRQKLAYAAFVLILLAMPLVTPDYFLILVAEIAILAIFAASLHFLLGPGGIGSFGHAFYFGIGAYTAAFFSTKFGINTGWALIAAPLLAAFGGLVTGWLCVRSSGIYLAMLTFAFAQIAWAIAFQWYDVTGGDNGMLGIWPSAWAAGSTALYYLAIIPTVISLFALRKALFAPFGYTLRACRDSPSRAVAIGINVRRFQWMGFVFSGIFAGLAGCLFAYAKGSVFPTTLDMSTSVDAIVMTLTGGINFLDGPAVGSVIYTSLKSEISRHTELWRAILGFIILFIVVAFPEGIMGFGNKILGRWMPERIKEEK